MLVFHYKYFFVINLPNNLFLIKTRDLSLWGLFIFVWHKMILVLMNLNGRYWCSVLHCMWLLSVLKTSVLCLQANLSAESEEIFKFMHDQGIGTELSCFYESWANVTELGGHTKKADSIYQLGMNRGAQPISQLQRKHE